MKKEIQYMSNVLYTNIAAIYHYIYRPGQHFGATDSDRFYYTERSNPKLVRPGSDTQ